MSNIRRNAHALIDNLSDEQVFHVYNILKSIKILNVPEVEPDEFDIELIEEANIN